MITSVPSYHQSIRQFLTQSADTVARETKFVQRQSPLTGSLFVHGLVWGAYMLDQFTLEALCGIIEKLDPSVVVSEQALDQRFTERAVALMKEMFALSLRQTLGSPSQVLPVLERFSAAYLLDSSTVSLPESLKEAFLGCGGSGPKAAVKVYLLLDWLKGSYEAIELRNGRQPDQNMGSTFLQQDRSEGALWLFDLGFWNLAFLKDIAAQGSYFLSRLQSQVSLSVREAGELVQLDLDSLLSKVSGEALFEMDVVLGAKQEVEARLVCVRVPEQVTNARRRKANQKAKKHGKTLSKKARMRLAWGLYVTNSPKEWLSTEAIEVIYRVRWQVELAFKLLKTDASLDKTTSENADRVLCEFYARLIGLCLFHALMALFDEREVLSYPKAWRRMRDDVLSFGKALHRGNGLVQLKVLLSYLGRRSKKSKREKYPSTLQRVVRAQQTSQIREMVNPIRFLNARKAGAATPQEQFFLHYCAIPEQMAA